jgi:predicted dehydrogenase
MTAASIKNNVFLMEAMWTRFLPAIRAMDQWIREGRIGAVRMVDASFGFRIPVNPSGRLFNPDLAGGGLFDVGVYVLSFAQMVLNDQVPSKVTGVAEIGSTGVDDHSAFSLLYPGGEIASLRCGFRTKTLHQGIIYGTDGYIRVPEFWHAQEAVLCLPDKPEQVERFPYEGSGFQYEIQAAVDAIQAGKLSADLMTPAQTLEIHKIMDELRRQWNLVYPFEK